MIFNTASDFASTTCSITFNLKASCTCIFIGYLIKPSPLLLSKWDAEGKKKKKPFVTPKRVRKGSVLAANTDFRCHKGSTSRRFSVNVLFFFNIHKF